MDRSSRKFESGVAFSKGWAEFTLKNPPPLVPSCLMAIWDAAGPTARTCSLRVAFVILGWPFSSRTGLPSLSVSGTSYWVGWTTVDLRVLAERLDHALGDEDEREHERERQQDVERRPGQVDPEVPDGLGRAAREASDERGERGHAGRGGDEVLDRQAQHLGEVAHRRLAAVPLPVRVAGEADGGVERRVGRHGAEPLRVERQAALEALEEVYDQQAREVEEEHRERVGLPPHLAVGLDAGKPVDEALEPPEDPVQADRAPLVDARHVDAERLGQGDEDDQVKEELHDPAAGHENTSGLSSATTRYTSRPTATTPPITYKMGMSAST